MPTNYNDHKIYIKVVKLQSITRTAEALGLPKSKASRALSKMELIWGAQLLTRSARSIQVTEAGQLVYQHCINLVADAEKTTEAIETTQHHISGRIRITAPEAFGGLCLAPILQNFLAEFKETQVDVVLSSDYESLIEGEFDLAFRIGSLEDSTLKARSLVKTQLGIYASPKYIKKAGSPATLKDLPKHNCLIYTGMPQYSNWSQALGEKNTRGVSGNVSSNNEMFLIEMALAGQGLLLFPEILLNRYLQNGNLEPVMPDHSSSIDVSIVYPFTTSLSSKIRVFIDYVADALNQH